MGLFKRDMDDEVSGGQVFGYILILAVIIFLIAFGIFVITKKMGIDTTRDNAKRATAVEASTEIVVDEDK